MENSELKPCECSDGYCLRCGGKISTRHAERSRLKIKWPPKQRSYASINGQEYTTDFQDGWNNAIDACRRAYNEDKK